MSPRLLTRLLLVSAAFITPAASSHHSFTAQYDADSPVSLSGYLIKMDWRNPHVYFFLEVETEDGDIEEWAFEMGSPIAMERNGWTRNSVGVGDILEVEGSLARDGSRLVNANSVTMADSGRRLFVGSSRADGSSG